MGVFMFGYISAHMNPAVCLALLILGKTGGGEFGAAIAGEFLGAFLGALLVWLHFLPHFKTVPQPPATSADDYLLKTGDALSPTALGIASYNVHVEDVAARRRGFPGFKQAFQDIKYYLKNTYADVGEPEAHAALVEVALGPDAGINGAEAVAAKLRRRSVQVCDVHRRLKDVDIEDFKVLMMGNLASSPALLRAPTSAGAAVRRSSTFAASRGANASFQAHDDSGLPHSRSDLGGHSEPANGSAASAHAAPPPAVERRQEKLDRLYDAAIVADQNVKLSIFATRPAIYAPALNFLAEFMCTTALIYGALMVYARRDLLYGPEYLLFRSQEGIYIGFFVFLCILGLGGPTGIAANPARDFSPRLAHFLLPIPGKGPSEWYYAWVPFFADWLGGCAAAGLYAATQLLNNSKVGNTLPFPGQIGA